MREIIFRPFTFVTAADNYQPHPRDYVNGQGEMYDTDTVTNGVQLSADQFADIEKVILIVDDGKTAVPYFYGGGPATKGDGQGKVWFHPFPTNPNGATRPDNGRVIDFMNWMLGPKRAYHLKITFTE